MKDKNEIKKALYKEKPTAIETDKGTSGPRLGNSIISTYQTKLEDETILEFHVPHNDMGEKRFEKEMPAQLLIRWLVI